MADLRHLLATYVHAHQTGNSVPPHIDAEARATLAAEAPAPADPSDFQTLQGIALDMVESLRPIVLPEILGVLRRAIKQPPAPAPAADPLLGLAATLAASQRPMDPDVAAALTPEARWQLYDGEPPPAADGEREELAQWLEDEAVYYEGLSTEASAKATRAAALLREARPQPVPGWQPIDTAPHDGSEILASDYDAIEAVSWDAWENGSEWIDRNGQRLFPAWWQPLPDHPPIPQPPQAGKVGRWPETYSRRQRAEEAERLCTEAGIDLKSPDAQRLVRDAENGMPLHDVLDLIKHWNATITTEPPTDD